MNRILRAVMIERLALLAGCVSLINGEHSEVTGAFLRAARSARWGVPCSQICQPSRAVPAGTRAKAKGKSETNISHCT